MGSDGTQPPHEPTMFVWEKIYCQTDMALRVYLHKKGLVNYKL